MLQARVRISQHQELQARVRSGQLRNCVFLHLRKDLERAVQSVSGSACEPELLPGVTKDKLDVKVHDSSLLIEAEAMVPTPQNLRVQHAEIREPHFARTFTLSADFDTSRIEASLQDGVLKLTIPRRDEARPRRIEIKTS